MLIGNLGSDPEMVHFENGGSLAKFSIATSESYKNRNGDQVTHTEWHNIVVSRKGLADVVERYLKKGDKVFVEGKIRTRTYESNGQKKYFTEVLVDNLTMLGSPKDQESNTPPTQATPQQNQTVHEPSSPASPDVNKGPEDDDLPF